MQSIALGTGTVVEIISAYSSTNQDIDSAASGPAWHTVGAFYMPADSVVKLEAIGLVSDPSVAMTCRLFDILAALPVSGSDTVGIDGMTTERQISGAFQLTGRKLYEIQAQVIGADAQSGVLYSASLVNG